MGFPWQDGEDIDRRHSDRETLSFRYVFAGVFGPIVLILIFVLIVNLLQAYSPKILPERLKTWSWLPRPLRSLGWYDEHLCGANRRLLCCNAKESRETPALVVNQNAVATAGQSNRTFNDDNDSVDRLSSVSTRF